MTADQDLNLWRARWNLTADGSGFVTEYTLSHVQPVVTHDGRRAVLKIATAAEERRGGEAMVWWAGRGTARVLDHDGEALLLERLAGEGDLKAMAGGAEDDAATLILCDVAMAMHRPAEASAPLVPLYDWFAELSRAAVGSSTDRPLFEAGWQIAQGLFAEKKPPVALHGDMHHGNAMRSADGAWLAIDPKGLVGDAGYDFANILHNPTAEVAHAPGRLGRQARIIAVRTRQPLQRVLRWAIAHGALSAAWSLADGRQDRTDLRLTTVRIAQAELAAAA